MKTHFSKRCLNALTLLIVVAAQVMPVIPALAAGPSVVLVDNLDPSWDAAGGGGVYSAYIAPPAYDYVSPGTTASYDGRQAGIIKAGLTPKMMDTMTMKAYSAFNPT